jgi:hypothetical protein
LQNLKCKVQFSSYQQPAINIKIHKTRPFVKAFLRQSGLGKVGLAGEIMPVRAHEFSAVHEWRKG